MRPVNLTSRQRGVAVMAELRKPVRTDEEREVLFGATQYQRR